jgi:hypothetical protein
VNDPAPRARLLVGLLLLVKLGVTAWNCHSFGEEIYDQRHHAWRARTAGLEVTWLSYNGPVYYMPVLPALVAGPLDDDARLHFLRWTNLLHLAVTYGLWIYFLFPRLIPDERGRVLASVVLLLLPGFQKLAAMVHPDNLLVSSTTVSLALWLLLRDRLRADPSRLPRGLLAAMTLSLAVLGLSRPFALAPLLVIWAAVVRELVRGRRLFTRAALVPVAAFSLAAAFFPVGWQLGRWLSSGHLTDVYGEEYMERFEEHRAGFDRGSYLTTSTGRGSIAGATSPRSTCPSSSRSRTATW